MLSPWLTLWEAFVSRFTSTSQNVNHRRIVWCRPERLRAARHDAWMATGVNAYDVVGSFLSDLDDAQLVEFLRDSGAEWSTGWGATATITVAGVREMDAVYDDGLVQRLIVDAGVDV